YPAQRLPPDLTAARAVLGRHRLEERLRCPPHRPVLCVDDEHRRLGAQPNRGPEPGRLVALDVVAGDMVPPRYVLLIRHLPSSGLRPRSSLWLAAAALPRRLPAARRTDLCGRARRCRPGARTGRR